MTDTLSRILQARRLLEALTPLKSDCGRICGARCCASMDGEETGMLLFPGEEALLPDEPGWQVLPAPAGKLVLCPGRCRRSDRPLSCRLFPLLPLPCDGGVRAVTDERARGVCPLARQGKSAMDPAFTDAVLQTGRLLLEDPVLADFLRVLAREQAEWKQLRRSFLG